jgi:MoxR-like ATPase
MRQTMFEQHETYLKGLDLVFNRYQMPSEEMKTLIATVLLVRNSTTLLNGISGTGKTALACLIEKVFFSNREAPESDFGYVSCTQDLTPMDLLFMIDLGALMKGNEVVLPRQIVLARLKFINEVQRANSLVFNALLPLLSEKYAVYRDRKFFSPDFVCIMDANPFDSGSTEMPAAFIDRIDFAFDVPKIPPMGVVGFIDEQEADDHFRWRMLSDGVKPVLDANGMQSLWDAVRMIGVPRDIRFLCGLIAGYLQQCQYADRSRVSPEYELPCFDCTFRGEICAKLAVIPGLRFIKSLLKLAQAKAWLRRSQVVQVEDLLYGLPYVLNHRLKIKPDSLRLYPNKIDWVKEELYLNGIRGRIPKWRKLVYACLEKPSQATELLEELGPMDLSVFELGLSLKHQNHPTKELHAHE